MVKRTYTASVGSSYQAWKKARTAAPRRMAVAKRSAPHRSSRFNAARRGLNRRGLASQETGYVDLASAAYALDTTGSITLLATVAQGASVNQRVGKKIVWKSLQCRGLYLQNNTATINDCAVLIVYDKRPTGSLPVVTDVLVSANSSSFNNDANSGRFVILKRIDFTLTGNAVTPATGDESMEADFFLPLFQRQGVFKAAGTGAIGDIEEGALYLITCGNTAAGANAAQATLAFRTRFIDV